MDNTLISLLKQTGFTQKEAMVYMALLELGQGDVTDIAKIAGLKRSTIYVLLDGLIEKGYVNQIKGKKVNTYQSIDPAVIYSQVKNTSKILGEMLPFLQSLRNKGKKKPKMHFIDTKAGIWKVYEEISNSREAFFLTSNVRMQHLFPDAIDKWIHEYKKRISKIKGRHLVPNTQEEIKLAKKFIQAGQNVRLLNDADKISMDFTLYGNKVALTLLEEEPFMVLIESEELATSMKIIFEIMWKAGQEIKNK